MLNVANEVGNISALHADVGDFPIYGMWGLFHWVQSQAFYMAFDEFGFYVSYVKEGE